MLKRIFASALVAGVIVGACVSVIQALALTPLLVQAESFERGERTMDGHSHSHGNQSDEGEDHHGEGGDIHRLGLTILANIITAFGFGLALTAGIAIAEVFKGDVYPGEMDWRRGAIWGLAGYAVFSLAPAMGLPPDVPGAMRADLFDRQEWWAATAAATAIALALLFYFKPVAAKIAAVVLLVAPHIIGAPRPEDFGGIVPAELAVEFAVKSIVVAGLFWLALGTVCGHLYGRFKSEE